VLDWTIRGVMHAENGWDASGLALLRGAVYRTISMPNGSSVPIVQIIWYVLPATLDLERLFSRSSSFRFLDASLEVTRMLAIASCNP
jgi:hypothetical protein